MRRRNREISIFNLSMLDVISGAMAAFLIIMVILMPYYRKEHVDYQAMLEALRAEVAALQQSESEAEARAAAAEARAEAAEAEAQRQQTRADALARQLAKTFLVLYIRWNTRDDVDLHVTDPAGAEFSFRNKTIAGRPGELSEDNVNGPGNEVWEIRAAPPGSYRVQVKLFADKGGDKPVRVQGRLFHRDGSNAFPEVSLNHQGQMTTVATIVVAADGGVGLR